MGSFYPHGKPGYYAYTEHFVEVGNDRAGKAKGNTIFPGLNNNQEGAIVKKALQNLQNIINGARAAELAFLNATGINLKDPKAADIFRNINEIFNSKQTIDRGLQYMKKLASSGKDAEKEQMYRDVSRYFAFYLDKAIARELKGIGKKGILRMNKGQIQNLINNIISNALILSYLKVKDFVDEDGNIRGKFGKDAKTRGNEEEKRAITDMIRVIHKLKNKNVFGKYGYLFNLDEKSLLKQKNKANYRLKKNKFHDAQVDSNYGGNALEMITSVVAAEIGNINIANSGLTIKGVHTGQMNQMKADTMLFVGRGTINTNDYLEYVNKNFKDSVRLQNVDALSKYLNDLQSNIEHVIMISDKNYSITADFGGINAQEKMSLENAGMMLSQFKVGQIPELINYLANCGDSMIQGAVNDAIRTELQTLIGYFLFDHLQIHVGGSTNVNVVNLLNVSGMYIPLSVYLEGVYKAIEGALGNPSSFVSVTISLGGKTEESDWTASNWGKFRQSHETESFISYKILKDIASFISGL